MTTMDKLILCWIIATLSSAILLGLYAMQKSNEVRDSYLQTLYSECLNIGTLDYCNTLLED